MSNRLSKLSITRIVKHYWRMLLLGSLLAWQAIIVACCYRRSPRCLWAMSPHHDTPILVQLTSSFQCKSRLMAASNAVIPDLERIPDVDFDSMTTALLPSVPEALGAAIQHERLRTDSRGNADNVASPWSKIGDVEILSIGRNHHRIVFEELGEAQRIY